MGMVRMRRYYILLFVLHGRLGKALLVGLLLCLAPHGLLNDVVDFVRITLVENGSLDELLTSVNVMMVSMSSMNRTFRIGFLHNCMVLTVHFGERCVHSLPIDTISFKVLIELDHWELLLQR